MRWLIGTVVAVCLCSSAAAAELDERSKIQVALQDNWLHCLLVFGQTVAATSDEKAELIADASFTACRQEERVLYDFYASAKPPILGELATTKIYPLVKDSYRQEVIAKVLVVRASEQLQQ